jgi:hypothetical protein
MGAVVAANAGAVLQLCSMYCCLHAEHQKTLIHIDALISRQVRTQKICGRKAVVPL